MSRKVAPSLQFAALPYRRRADGNIEVMLVTSLNTRRWVIPKGWPVQRMAPHDSAAREAVEEGGLVGRTGQRSIGFYRYKKRLANGSSVRCQVETFLLKVTNQLTSWPEQDQRRTQWFALQEAADAVQEPKLSAMIRKLAVLLREE